MLMNMAIWSYRHSELLFSRTVVAHVVWRFRHSLGFHSDARCQPGPCIECTRLFRSQEVYFNLSQVFLPVHLILQGCLLRIQELIFTPKEKYKRMYNTPRLANIFIYSVSPRVEVLHTRNHEVPIFHLCCGLPRLCCPVSDHRRCYYWRAEHRNSG